RARRADAATARSRVRLLQHRSALCSVGWRVFGLEVNGYVCERDQEKQVLCEEGDIDQDVVGDRDHQITEPAQECSERKFPAEYAATATLQLPERQDPRGGSSQERRETDDAGIVKDAQVVVVRLRGHRLQLGTKIRFGRARSVPGDGRLHCVPPRLQPEQPAATERDARYVELRTSSLAGHECSARRRLAEALARYEPVAQRLEADDQHAKQRYDDGTAQSLRPRRIPHECDGRERDRGRADRAREGQYDER